MVPKTAGAHWPRVRFHGTAGKAKRSGTLKDGSIPERVIQAQILSWLKEANVLHWRQNSGVVFAGNRMVRLGEEGLPDIVVIVPPGGRLLGLEVKSAKGQLRPSQKAFKAIAEANGAAFHVVRSLEQAKYALALSLGEEQWKRLLSSTGLPGALPPPSPLPSVRTRRPRLPPQSTDSLT